MCGVAGVLNFDGSAVDASHLKAMTDALAHRGPDGEGCYTDGVLGLGHRRLAVIDVTPAGNQPMVSADGRWVLSYNGEIYNFRELRRELEKEGCRFRSRTDSEVLLYALATWGTDALARLNGMFAFALWDRHRQELLIARDRFGIKPMYYCLLGRAMLFASEVKAFLPYPGFRVALDKSGLVEYFTFQNFVSNRTLFRGVSTLPAGHYMLLGRGEHAVIDPIAYWNLDVRTVHREGSDAEYVEEFDRLFEQAVTRQLVSDVPVGSYLSGGLDSGSIAAVASRRIPGMDTFTVGFNMSTASESEAGFDERLPARQMSRQFGTLHHEMEIGPRDFERSMEEVIWHLEVPRVGQCYPNLYAARVARRFATVVLAGTGGDELFGGYPWRYSTVLASEGFEDYLAKYYSYWQRLMPEEGRRLLFSPIWEEVGGTGTFGLFRDVFASRDRSRTSPDDLLNHCIHFDAKTFLQGLLAVEDALSMAYGLETRVPFLDNDLAEFAQRLPAELKVSTSRPDGPPSPGVPSGLTEHGQELNGKVLLRKALERYVPETIARRPKQGFSAPDASWFRNESEGYLRARLWDDAMLFDYLEPDEVRRILEEHFEGRRNARLAIWSLLSFEQWCRTFLDR